MLFALLTINLCAQNDAVLPHSEDPPEFVTDGCSWFPDGNYRDCCVDHDRAYFKGGSWQQRLKADNKLFSCVSKKRGWYQPIIAPFMWAGTRVFGVSFLPTSFRWGFGKNKSKIKTKAQKPKK